MHLSSSTIPRSPLIATADRAAYVCFWHKAGIAIVLNDVRFRG
jgi:hypothetical protein